MDVCACGGLYPSFSHLLLPPPRQYTILPSSFLFLFMFSFAESNRPMKGSVLNFSFTAVCRTMKTRRWENFTIQTSRKTLEAFSDCLKISNFEAVLVSTFAGMEGGSERKEPFARFWHGKRKGAFPSAAAAAAAARGIVNLRT